MPDKPSTRIMLNTAVHLLVVALDNARRLKLSDPALVTKVQTSLDNAKEALALAAALEKG